MFRVPPPRPANEHVRVSTLAAVFEPGVTDDTDTSTLVDMPDTVSRDFAQRVIWPLARRCAKASVGPTTPVVGVVGGPGAGKTTFARDISTTVRDLFGLSALVMSLDDFYFPPETLAARGLAWRALPGSHDVPRLISVLDDVIAQKSCQTEVPRFDMETGRAARPETIDLPVDLCVIEGWLIGHDSGPYGTVSERLDLLVYLDLPMEELRRSRLRREADIREATYGRRGMPAEVTEAFWEEALEPGVRDWVLPIRDRSDIIVKLAADRSILSIDVAANVG